MLTYEKLSRKPKLFKSFAGFEVEELDSLLVLLTENTKNTKKNRLQRDGRIRTIGAGRKFSLDLEEKLLMLLVYYRLYVTCALADFLFDVEQSNVWRTSNTQNHWKKLHAFAAKSPQQDKVDRYHGRDFGILPRPQGRNGRDRAVDT